MTAFEELKAWCEKHMAPNDYTIVPESQNFGRIIYFEPLGNDNLVPCVVFEDNGDVQNFGISCHKEDHIADYARRTPLTESRG